MAKVIDTLGGEEGLRALVERFYDIVEGTPEGAHITRLHRRGHGMAHARIEQFNFLSGFTGGRRYYAEKHGHMDVKRMHEHVPITQQDAEDWLACMDRALQDLGHQGPDIDHLRRVFRRVAQMLVNDLGDWGQTTDQSASRTT